MATDFSHRITTAIGLLFNVPGTTLTTIIRKHSDALATITDTTAVARVRHVTARMPD